MSSVHEDYMALLVAAKQFLLEEFKRDQWFTTTPETYHYFKTLAVQKQVQTQTPRPVPVNNIAPAQAQPLPKSHYSPLPPAPPASAVGVAAKPIVTPPPVLKTEPKIQLESLKDVEQESKVFQLSPLLMPKEIDLSDFKKIVAQIAPLQMIVDQPLTDSPEVLIVCGNEPPEQQAFLKNIAQAINLTIASAVVISSQRLEHATRSPKLRFIIGSTFEKQKEGIKYLQLHDIALYLNAPEKKALLWKEIRALYVKE